MLLIEQNIPTGESAERDYEDHFRCAIMKITIARWNKASNGILTMNERLRQGKQTQIASYLKNAI